MKLSLAQATTDKLLQEANERRLERFEALERDERNRAKQYKAYKARKQQREQEETEGQFHSYALSATLNDPLHGIIESPGAEAAAPQPSSGPMYLTGAIGVRPSAHRPAEKQNVYLSGTIGMTSDVDHPSVLTASGPTAHNIYLTDSTGLPEEVFPPTGPIDMREEAKLIATANQLVTVVQAGGRPFKVGAGAIESIITAVIKEQIAHSQREYMFPANVSEASIPLSQRLLLDPDQNHFTPSRPTDESHDLELIFSLLLKVLEEKIQARMSQEPIDN